jgi:hypothetical protein
VFRWWCRPICISILVIVNLVVVNLVVFNLVVVNLVVVNLVVVNLVVAWCFVGAVKRNFRSCYMYQQMM